jgi:hypothetical protein
MITPANHVPPDDSETEDDEQLSQQDIHSNGFEDDIDLAGDDDETDALNQAYDASEPSYTLDSDEDED